MLALNGQILYSYTQFVHHNQTLIAPSFANFIDPSALMAGVKLILIMVCIDYLCYFINFLIFSWRIASRVDHTTWQSTLVHGFYKIDKIFAV